MSPPDQDETRTVADWLDRFFASYHARRPVNATFIGHHQHDHRLPDLSPGGLADTGAEMEDLLAVADRLPEPGDRALRIDLRLARGYLETQIWEQRSSHGPTGNPALHTGDAVFGLIGLFLTDFAPIATRIESAIARLEGIPRFLAEARTAVATAPADWTDRAVRECDGAVAFLTDGIDQLIATHRVAGPALRRAADRAVAAFATHRAHLDGELRHRPNERLAAGSDALALQIRKSHCLTETADEIADYAAGALAKADDYLARHRADEPDHPPHPTVERYYHRYREIWDAARDAAEAHRLVTWPDFPIRYLPRPSWARTAAPHLYFLFYRSPAAFDRPPIHDYLVTPIDESLPRDVQETLLRANDDHAIKLNHVIHHGGIGHHVQNWHAFRAASRIGRIAAVDCAARIAMPCGGTMAEGWACYATDLMAEIGFLTDAERLDEAKTRRRMSARAVVDVRLHQGRLTLDGAAEYYQRAAGMPAAAARAEAVKNSMFPGMALMYLIGTDAIHRLRNEVAARRGDRFSLAEFHDEFLAHGSIPVALIAELMRADAAQ